MVIAGGQKTLLQTATGQAPGKDFSKNVRVLHFYKRMRDIIAKGDNAGFLFEGDWLCMKCCFTTGRERFAGHFYKGYTLLIRYMRPSSGNKKKTIIYCRTYIF